MSRRYNYLFSLFFIGMSFSVKAQISNDICNAATPVALGITCNQSNQDATTDSETDCVVESEADVWYQYTANFSGILSIHADISTDDTLFNDVLTIFSGDCSNLTQIHCSNYDEYGFQGEKYYLTVNTGTTYYIRLSGQLRNFGASQGDFCLKLHQENSFLEVPTNDHCADAISLTPNADWTTGSNEHATMSNYNLNETARRRADVWYQFTPQIGEEVTLQVQADFSHSIALYEGDCTDLSLIEKDLDGFILTTSNLSPSTPYYIQISGNFATLEGNFDIKVTDTAAPPNPNNDNCLDALALEIGQECLEFDLADATFSSIRPACLFYPGADIWFKYVAPLENATGFKINTGADFPHGVAVYEGACMELVELLCSKETLACEEYLTVQNLTPNGIYYIQIVADEQHFPITQGSGCIEILNNLQSDNFVPLSLNVIPFCQSENGAELQVAASGGFGNYTFYGNNQGDIIADGDTYFVQVTDEKGCTQAAAGTIDCSTPAACDLFYHLDTQNTSCAENEDGSATLLVASEESLTYEWSTGATGDMITDVAAGTYSVTVTTASGCLFNLPVIIESPSAVSSTTLVNNATELSGSDGSITILPTGGVPPFSYEWNTGVNTQTATNLEASTYAYVLYDANNCSHAGTATVDLDSLCPANRVLTADIAPNTANEITAGDWIISTSTINNQATMQYKAGNSIQLRPGFRAIKGSSFHAFIEECVPLVLDIEEEEEKTPVETPEPELLSVYPNPASNTATIALFLARPEFVTVDFYDARGNLVYQLLDHENLADGTHQIHLNLKNLPSGLYSVAIYINGSIHTKSVAVVR